MSKTENGLAKIKEDLFKPLLEAYTLPGECYWKPEYYESELKHIFQKKWICVGRVEDIPLPGNYITETIGNDPIVVARNAEGEIKAHINVCRHRGCKVVEDKGPGDEERVKFFKCPYHGWLYGLDGELRGTPDFDNTKNFDKKENSLFPVAVEVWDGFIFVNMDLKASSFAESISEATVWGVDKYSMTDMVTIKQWDYNVKCNWKAYVDNYIEPYHVPWVHPITFQANTPLRIWKNMTDLTEQDWVIMFGQKPGVSISNTGEALLDIPEELSTIPDEFDGMPIWLTYPTFMCIPVADCMIYYVAHPRGPEETEIKLRLCIREETHKRLEAGDPETIRIVDEYKTNTAWFIGEDNEISEKQQRGLRSTLSYAGRYSHHEALMHKFNQWVFKTAYEKLL